jgi:ribonuclease HII
MTAMVRLMAEAYRLSLLRELEESLCLQGFDRVAGLDEAGRGALAGPVVAAAVITEPGIVVPGVDDSKQLSPASRERLAEAIRGSSAAWAVGAVGAERIDRINILEATREAMTRALESLSIAPSLLLIDAVALSETPCPCLSFVKGDRISYSVACASILAKVERDRMMQELDGHYPEYGFAQHKGYGAAGHLEALSRYGPSPEHRLTFRSVLPRTAKRAS